MGIPKIVIINFFYVSTKTARRLREKAVYFQSIAVCCFEILTGIDSKQGQLLQHFFVIEE